VTTFLALYRGATVGEAKLISVSADPDLVAVVAGRLLDSSTDERVEGDDAILGAVANGRQRALWLIAGNANVGAENTGNKRHCDKGDGEC